MIHYYNLVTHLCYIYLNFDPLIPVEVGKDMKKTVEKMAISLAVNHGELLGQGTNITCVM